MEMPSFEGVGGLYLLLPAGVGMAFGVLGRVVQNVSIWLAGDFPGQTKKSKSRRC